MFLIRPLALATLAAAVVILGACSAPVTSSVDPGGLRSSTATRSLSPNSTPSIYAATLPRFGVAAVSRDRSASWVSPEATVRPIVYVSDYDKGVVYIYRQKGKNQAPIGKLTGFTNPQGLHVTDTDDLYVCSSGSQQIFAFHRGAKTPFATLTDPGQEPTGVSVDGSGVVYVTNLGTNTISVYSGGSTTPTSTITDANASSVYFIAADFTGQLYVTYVKRTGAGLQAGAVDEIASGVTTTLPIALAFPGGIALDHHDNLMIVDQFVPSIATYAPPYTGGPTGVIHMTGDPVTFALNFSGTALWDANASNLDAEAYSVPGGTLLDSTSKSGLSLPIGAAVDPRIRT